MDKIARDVAPQRIILFGSLARGEATESSDLDLFVVQDSAASNREVRRRIESLLGEADCSALAFVNAQQDAVVELDAGRRFAWRKRGEAANTA